MAAARRRQGAAAPTEEVVAQGLERAKEVIAEVIELQEEFLAQVGVKPSDFEPAPVQQDLWDALEPFAKDKVKAAIVPDKKEREANMSGRKDEAKALASDARRGRVRAARPGVLGGVEVLEKKVMRARVIEEGVPRRRGPRDIRPLAAHVSLLPGRTAPRCSSAATRRS